MSAVDCRLDMSVELIDKMGSDLSVVNAARVSFGKEHKKMTDGDKKLIKYLADHEHWSPFAHTALQFRISAPIFVARQLVKHTVGLAWNEISRRYVDDDPEYFWPDVWRGKPEDKKQGSSEQVITWLDRNKRVGSAVQEVYEAADETYRRMLDAGICPEQARMVLPQSAYTQWFWTGSLYAFARVCNLRCKEDAQEETRDVAWRIDKFAGLAFPVSWEALRDI